MDRLKLTLAGCGLAALLAAPGCRNLRSEVPAGRSYSSDGREMPSVGFSNDAHPAVGAAAPPTGMMGMSAGEASAAPQLGTPAPGSRANYGAPTDNAYGPPGTSTGLGAGASSAPPAAMDPAGSAPAASGMPSSPPPAAGAGLPGSTMPPG